MSLKPSILTTILVIAIVTAFMPMSVQGWNVSKVSHSPEIPKTGEDVEITIEFEDASNISSIFIIYCTIEPFKCQAPVDISENSVNENTFTYTITKKYDPGTQIGFKFKVTYQNSTIQYVPKSQDDSNIHSLSGPFGGSYYFIYTLESELPLLYIIVPFLIVSIVPVIIAILFWKKKRKGKKHEDEK